MPQVTVYGIANCDTVKKARRWLDEQGVEYHFYNFKKEGASAEQLERWTEIHGIDKLLNRRGTTWRKLSDEQKSTADQDSAVARGLLQAETSMIKRPILEVGEQSLIGFDADQWSKVLE